MAKLKIPIIIDKQSNVIFVTLTVVINNKVADIPFKLDTGCNSVVLKHKTLQAFGIDTTSKAMRNKPSMPGRLADGTSSNFKQVGDIALYSNGNLLAKTGVICHATQETNNLLGTSVLHRYLSYKIQVGGDFQYLELEK
ncbi:MAG: hypothetical protein LBE35_10145 [Clostridiales bacterium]|jgi:predicted aspartyl protease|nr:hypothetical protein [Clostridiales bacterium]